MSARLETNFHAAHNQIFYRFPEIIYIYSVAGLNGIGRLFLGCLGCLAFLYIVVSWPIRNTYNWFIKAPPSLSKSNRETDEPRVENQNNADLERICGSIIGLAVGDALGAPVEFRPYDYMLNNRVTDFMDGGTWGLARGQFTDDTSMALCLAYSLVTRGRFSLYDQLVRYKHWYRNGFMSSTGECFDMGAATRMAIQEFEKRQCRYAESIDVDIKKLDEVTGTTTDPNIDCKCGAADAAGNGSLMRLAPVPLFFFREPRWAIIYSGESSLSTHGDIRAYDACRFYGALIVGALKNLSKEELLAADFYEKHSDWFDNKPLNEEIQTIMRGSYRTKQPGTGGIRGAGYVAASLEAALWAFANDNNLFETGVLLAVNLGDDTDTTAAIYGQLAGAFYGFKQIPERWRTKIHDGCTLKDMSDQIYSRGSEWIPDQHSYDSNV